MGTYLDVYKIPNNENIGRYDYTNINYDDKYLVHTAGGFDTVNIIMSLFNLSFDKAMIGSDGLFDGSCYVIKYEEFLRAKTLFDDYIELIMEECGIEKHNFKYRYEHLKDFFTTTEPVLKDEKELYFWIG